MIQFENTYILYALILIPFFWAWFWLNKKRNKRQKDFFADKDLLNNLMPDYSARRLNLKFILRMLALTFLIIGLSNPRIGSKLKEVKRKGVELIIAMDVSNSMMAEDIKPNRLERSKRTVSQLVDKLHGDKVGLIVFAGKAYVQMPTTTDYRAAKMFLSSISPGIVPIQGTAIGEAISLSMESFTKNNKKNKVMLIITDGENHEEDAITLAKEAASKGVRIYTIGMGHPKGTPIPVIDRFGRKEYRRDKNGDVVITKLNETFLQEIAANTNGLYIPANRLDNLVDEMQKMDQQEFESKIYSDYEDRFQYFFGIALLLLLIEQVILNRKNKYLKNINLFNNKTLGKYSNE